jgi:hypothetical protein
LDAKSTLRGSLLRAILHVGGADDYPKPHYNARADAGSRQRQRFISDRPNESRDYRGWCWRLCWPDTARERIEPSAASRSLKAACLLWSFSTARSHADAFAVAATSLGCLLLNFAANCASEGLCVRTVMASIWGRVATPLVEMGSAPKTTCRASCEQAGHLKICRSIGGAHRMVSPTTTCIRRISAPHARHCMILAPVPDTSNFQIRILLERVAIQPVRRRRCRRGNRPPVR